MKSIKSGKQRRAQIKAARKRRQGDRSSQSMQISRQLPHPLGTVPVSVNRLRPSNSYGVPLFVERGYYEDKPFSCVDCGVAGVWMADRQRWWYEVAQGDVFTTARRCSPCRAKERARREAARLISQEGFTRKASRLAAGG